MCVLLLQMAEQLAERLWVLHGKESMSEQVPSQLASLCPLPPLLYLAPCATSPPRSIASTVVALIGWLTGGVCASPSCYVSGGHVVPEAPGATRVEDVLTCGGCLGGRAL